MDQARPQLAAAPLTRNGKMVEAIEHNTSTWRSIGGVRVAPRDLA